MASFSTCRPLENWVSKTRFKAHIWQNNTSRKRNQSQKEKKKKKKQRRINKPRLARPGSRGLGCASPTAWAARPRLVRPGSCNPGRTAWVAGQASPRSRGLGGLARSISLPLWSDSFSLSYLVSLSLIWLSLSLIWSDRWGEAMLEAWEMFKIFLNYKSSLKDSIFKFLPHGK